METSNPERRKTRSIDLSLVARHIVAIMLAMGVVLVVGALLIRAKHHV